MKEKSEGQLLNERLSYKAKNIWEKCDDEYKNKINGFCEDYKRFLDLGKTERECTRESEKLLKANGFVSISEVKNNFAPGTKIYHVNRDKSLIAVVIGKEPLKNGLLMVGSHVDSPRIDLKPNPLYEEEG
ncbi:MAG: aminopeptidase, partial [Eubacteriales bacterium]|nr:aminopeptidase [Eubacteriales bacterium]